VLLEYAGKRPDVAPDAFVAETAVVLGTVSLGQGASVWFNAVLRGDNDQITIGQRTNVQDNCTVHVDPGFPVRVGAGVTIGHGAIVHGCTVEDNCLIGMGATVLNGATIGHDSLVGAGALVTEGKTIPPGSLVVGVPARVQRALTPEEIEGLRGSAQGYYDRSRAFLGGAAVRP
jgi:carbonic anhydrase/acetyltransferase-like protein (isoleucine patch superfamily)